MELSDSKSSRTLYVGGLTEEVDRDILYSAFIPFGEVRTVEIPLDKQTGKHRGFGFVEFEEEMDASHAVDNMHNSELYGRVLRVNMARAYSQQGASKSRPAWSDDFFYRQRLAEEGMEGCDDIAATTKVALEGRKESTHHEKSG